MKKQLLAISLLAISFVLVGCGSQKTQESAITNLPSTDKSAVTDSNAETNNPSDSEIIGYEPKNEEEGIVKLAQCLKDKGFTMYGTERCGHCKDQKKLFGEAFSYIDYIDCDKSKPQCLEAGVRGFPTWVDADGNPSPGTQPLATLAKKSGCEL